MRDAAAVVNTSTSEGQSGALLEAAAVGTPIVARDIPGNRSLLDLIHGKGGDTTRTNNEKQIKIISRDVLLLDDSILPDFNGYSCCTVSFRNAMLLNKILL